ncbi:MAG: threonine dehydratase [Epulopiscium sp. Nele67-Bin002]|nr:MAG: threonine ammonia-lyase [Epulopiscium sp. Nuni2H_MBin001]OON91066.1 MAG: threonine dehydratase [Epulopiscium sp. Nele67-Bin002]
MYLESIESAYDKIRDVVVRTPLIYSPTFSKICGTNNKVYLKCENLQTTGAYKLRGALHKIRTLSYEEKQRGVVCSSAGNHAQGVAYAATLERINATIVMPKTTPYLKVQATREFGGRVILHGACYDDAYKEARRIEVEDGATFIHPFDDIDIIAGQGSVGLEIFEDLPNADIIVCPIGGGGLISGISTYAKEYARDVKIIGVQSQGANAMARSFGANKLISLEQINTIAEGIAVKTPGELTFSLIQQYVDEILTVSDHLIVDKLLMLLEKHKLVTETSGAASLAALKQLNCTGKNVVCVLSGGNIDMLTLSSLVNSGFVSHGRLFCFGVELANVPGQLLNVSKLLTNLGANIVRLEHNQSKARNKYQNVQLEVTVETNGFEHIQRIKEAFEENDYFITPQY